MLAEENKTLKMIRLSSNKSSLLFFMSLTKSRSTHSSLLSATNDTGEVEVVVGFAGLRACRLRRWGRFGCRSRTRSGSRSGHPRFALG